MTKKLKTIKKLNETKPTTQEGKPKVTPKKTHTHEQSEYFEKDR